MTSHTLVVVEIIAAVCIVAAILIFIVPRVWAALAAAKVEGDRH